MKKISPNIKLKIIELSNCFWYWNSFYIFYASAMGISARELERKYPKDSHNKYKISEFILDDLENDIDKIKNIVSAFYKMRTPHEKNENIKYNQALVSLKEFKDMIGSDVINDEIEQKKIEKRIKNNKHDSDLIIERKRKLNGIKKEFYENIKLIIQEDKQKRGFWLEKKVYELLEMEGIECSPPYKTKTEQIDGHMKFKSFDYLIEVKWTDNQFKQFDVSVFDGKIKNKAQSNRGLVLSINGFGSGAIEAAKENRNLIFMDGQDLVSILEEYVTFFDFLITKEDQLVRLGLAYKK